MKKIDFQWHLTNRCNLRCRHCYQSQFQDDFKEHLIFGVAERLLGELKDYGCRTILNLTGGEPFLLGERFFSLLHLLDCSEPVQEITITTNGLLVNREMIQKISAYQKVTTLKISLEGACAETNDAIRGRGVFEKVVKKLQEIRENSTIQTILMFTVHKRNFSELEDMFTLSRNLGVSGLMVERFIPEGRGKMMSEELLGAQDWEDIVQKLITLTQIDVTPLELVSYRAFLVKFGKEIELWGAPCNLKETFCIMPDGTILPCRRFFYPLGNILKEGLFHSITNATLLQRVAEKSILEGKCRTCSLSYCFGCRALGYALSRNPFAEDIQCFMPG
ncbi:MAG: radical SAM protein [Atribacterota bacterium]